MEPFPPHYLESPLWHPWRQLIIAAKGDICTHCGIIASYPFIQPVQVIRGQQPWDYRVDQMQVACRDCYYGALDKATEFYFLLENFNDEEQQLILDMTEQILRKLSPGRQIEAERLCYLFEQNFSSLDEQMVPKAIQGKKAHVTDALLSIDSQTLEPLIDAVSLLQKMTPVNRGAALMSATA